MSGFSNWAENKIYNLMYRGQSWTPPAALYMALHTTDPGEDCSVGEVSWTGYTRAPVIMAAPTDGSGSNSADVVFAPPAGAGATITHFSLWDSISGGNPLAKGSLTASKVVATGEVVKCLISKLTCTVQ